MVWYHWHCVCIILLPITWALYIFASIRLSFIVDRHDHIHIWLLCKLRWKKSTLIDTKCITQSTVNWSRYWAHSVFHKLITHLPHTGHGRTHINIYIHTKTPSRITRHTRFAISTAFFPRHNSLSSSIYIWASHRDHEKSNHYFYFFESGACYSSRA